MEYYCTYCCKEKKYTDKKIKAIELYISERIKYVYNLSLKHQKKFIILSGKFGFLKPDNLIPYYDKLLQKNEVDRLVESLKNFIEENKISKLIFFHKSFKTDPNIINYFKAAEKAALKSNIPFKSICLK
jgi:hypothetical protein